MIVWYKRVYQITEDERNSNLEVHEILEKLQDHFDKPTRKLLGNLSKANNPYMFLNRGFNSFTITHTEKQWGAKDSRIPLITLIECEIFDLGKERKIKLVSQLPAKWILALLLTLVITYFMTTLYMFLVIALAVTGIYLWLRNCAKLDLVDVDIELYRCLKK